MKDSLCAILLKWTGVFSSRNVLEKIVSCVLFTCETYVAGKRQIKMVLFVAGNPA